MTSVTGKSLLQGRGKQLVEALKTLAGEMGEMGLNPEEQVEFDDSLRAALGHEKLIKSRDSDVKLLVACCHADLLRIYAPESPYEDDQLKDIFELLVSQLQGLEDVEGPSYERYVYLIERLAVVQSLVLMPDLGCDDLIQQLFEALFSASHPSQSRAVKNYALDILADVTEELQPASMAQPLLDSILENLVEPKRSECPAAYGLARGLIDRCSKQLLGPIHTFLQACLPSSLASAPEESELRDEWRSLIVELAAISPDTVTYLLPQLEGVVLMEDEHTREQGTELLGRLFMLEECDVAKHVPALFHNAFLGRLKDISPKVRAMAVEQAVPLIVAKPSLAGALVEAIGQRVLDADERVREIVVKAVCDICLEHLDTMAQLIPRVAYRMADKKLPVRKAARDGLCAVYRKHATAHLTARPSSVAIPEPLRVIGQCFLHCYGTDAAKDAEARLELETIITTKLLPADSALRLRSVCALHQALKPAQRKALRGLFLSKRMLQQDVARWADLHEKLRSKDAPKDAKEAAKEQQRGLMKRMADRMPDPAKAKEVWEAIQEAKDQKVVKQLVVLASSGSSYTEVHDAQTDFRQRVGQRVKEPLKAALDAIACAPAMTFLWPEGAEQLLDEVASDLASDDVAQRVEGTAVHKLELLLDVCSQSPATFATAGQQLSSALQSAIKSGAGEGSAPGPVDKSRRPALLLLLRLVHAASTQLSSAPPTVRKTIVAALCQLCCTAKDQELGKLAAQALTTQVLVQTIRSRTFETLFSKLSAHFDLSRPTQSQHCTLAVLAALAKREPEDSLGPDRLKLLRRLKEQALPPPSDAARLSDDGEADEAALPAPNVRARCTSQLLAVKLLANEALGSGSMLGSKPAASTSPADSTTPSDGTAASPPTAGPQMAHVADLLKRLVETLDVNGRVGAAAEAGDEQRAQLRLAAGYAILKIARVHHLKTEATVGPLGWHRLGLLMHDKVAEVRADFARKLASEQMRPFLFDKRESKLGAPPAYQVARRLGLPPQYMTFLALAACDPDKDNVKAAKALACHLVKSWRAAAERTKQTLPNASMGLPEAQLPWLVHLCAHHPDFEEEEAAMDDDDDEVKGGTLPTTQRMLDFYINACLANGANEFDLLRHVVNKVKTAVDRLHPNGQETRVVTAIARQLIEYRGDKATWSTKTVPPNLTLPALLYCRPSEQQQHGDVDLLPQNFTLIDGLKTSNHGFGAGATLNGAAQASTALVAHAGKRPSTSSEPGKRGRSVPSPVKRSKNAAKADDESDDDDESEEDDEERQEREREEREAKQQEERARRMAQREQRSDVLALPPPKEVPRRMPKETAKPSTSKRARQEEVLALPAPQQPAPKQPAPKARGAAKTAAPAQVDAENDGPNPRAGRAARSTRSARA